MSKAFKPNDEENDDDFAGENLGVQTPSGKNYITRQGADRLRGELRKLLDEERPKLVETIAWAASNGDRSENADYIYGKRRLREIDRKIRFLTKRLEIAEVIDPALQKSDRILFGAIVTVQNEEGKTLIVRIVGTDEVNASQGDISWISPLAKCLLNQKAGDTVTLRTPKGEEDLEILTIKYGDGR